MTIQLVGETIDRRRAHIWAQEGDCDPAALSSNLFEMEWPPRSGRVGRFPEADRGAWFAQDEAYVKISKGQRPVLDLFYSRFGAVS